ncbi:MAG: radical SAM protein, partial [Methanobrevibacter sp.]|nr:radical SAM protein [Methanobrevibacter sp.]
SFPLLQVTQGCTHNRCKFCTMYKDVRFRPQPMELIEEDLQELAKLAPESKTIQLLSANPLIMTYNKLRPILEKINEYLPEIEYIYAATRVSDLKNKTVEELESLRELGLREISLGVESGDDWTLERVNKGYASQDIIEQCQKLTDAGIDFWMSFLNGVAGKEHSMDHAINSANIFSECNPMLVGTGGLTLFEGTPLLDEARKGEFTPLTEKEMLIELKTFVEHLDCDCYFITHHTVSASLSGLNFLERKDEIVNTLNNEIEHGDMDRYAEIRRNKRSL